MYVMLEVLNTVPPKSSVPDVVFATIGAIANALEEEFDKYMASFTPFLYNALGNQEEPGLCSMAIGLVSDIARALNEKVQPYCDTFMNYLLTNLRVSFFLIFPSFIGRPWLTTNQSSTNQLKPAILETFGDIAQAIGTQFDTYLPVVAQVLQQASIVTASADVTVEMIDYIVSLREGIMDAWGGILLTYKGKPQGKEDSPDTIYSIY
jgi:importin subunit beta-1